MLNGHMENALKASLKQLNGPWGLGLTSRH